MGSITVVTTRRWNEDSRTYDDYNAKLGLDYVLELKDSSSFPPYLHIEESGQLFEKFPSNTLVDALKNEAYIGELNEKLLGTYEGEVVVYIHGFNCSLISAKTDALSIAAASGRKVVVFDWASTNSGSLVDIGRYYAKDAESALASVRALTWLLHVLLLRDSKLHIMCHSMGARVTIEAIKSMSHDYTLLEYGKNGEGIYKTMLSRIKFLIFKQPDVDIVNMSQFWFKEAHRISDFNRQIAIRIFAHNHDKALNASQFLHMGIPRIGQLSIELVNTMVGTGVISDNFANLLRSILIDASPFVNLEERHWVIDPRRYVGFENHSYFDNNGFKTTLRALLDGADPLYVHDMMQML